MVCPACHEDHPPHRMCRPDALRAANRKAAVSNHGNPIAPIPDFANLQAKLDHINKLTRDRVRKHRADKKAKT